jgi:hypothetical protein
LEFFSGKGFWVWNYSGVKRFEIVFVIYVCKMLHESLVSARLIAILMWPWAVWPGWIVRTIFIPCCQTANWDIAEGINAFLNRPIMGLKNWSAEPRAIFTDFSRGGKMSWEQDWTIIEWGWAWFEELSTLKFVIWEFRFFEVLN